MKQLENAGDSPHHGRALPTRSHFASVGSVLRDKAGKKLLDTPTQPVSLILLDRPSGKKSTRGSTALLRKSKRAKKDSNPPRGACSSAECDKRAHIEVNLDRAVLGLSEIKAEYHLEKTALDRQMVALDKKPAAAKKELDELPVSRDFPPSVREQKLAEKLEFAETTMRLLYEKNQELEQQISDSPLPHESCHNREVALEREIGELSSEAQALESQLTALWETRMQHTSACDYEQARIRQCLQDSKRYLGHYWALRQKVQLLVPDSASLSQLLALERAVREEERRESEQRLSQWEQLNCELYVKSRRLKRELP